MKIRDLGERPFLESIRDLISEHDDAVLEFDDDASDLPCPAGQHVVINVDTLVGSSDWLPGMSAAQVGRKAAVMVLSDIVTKGANPLATMQSLCVPADYDSVSAQEIVRGFSQYCLKSGIPLIGGDMGTASDVVLTGVGIGVADPAHIITRGDAQVGDIVAVTGMFGLTAVAFHILLNGLTADSSLHQRALLAAYKPSIDLHLVPSLAGAGAVTSSMDSSDGLGITLNTMASHSNMCFEITRLPIASGVASFAQQHSLDSLTLVMSGGEEFIPVLTIPTSQWDIAVEVARHNHVSLIRIGEVVTGSGVVYKGPDGEIDIPPTGYDNFREWT